MTWLTSPTYLEDRFSWWSGESSGTNCASGKWPGGNMFEQGSITSLRLPLSCCFLAFARFSSSCCCLCTRPVIVGSKTCLKVLARPCSCSERSFETSSLIGVGLRGVGLLGVGSLDGVGSAFDGCEIFLRKKFAKWWMMAAKKYVLVSE